MLSPEVEIKRSGKKEGKEKKKKSRKKESFELCRGISLKAFLTGSATIKLHLRVKGTSLCLTTKSLLEGKVVLKDFQDSLQFTEEAINKTIHLPFIYRRPSQVSWESSP